MFEEVASFENLLRAAKTAARGKRYRPSTATFLMRLESECLSLAEELRSERWRPGPYRVFEIHEPKRRTICAAPFRDRVVHQALVQVVEPLFERRFISDSYACRVGKGTHAALDRVERWAHEFPWVLKVDVEKYFPSIDHGVALAMLARRIACRRIIGLFATIVATWSSREAPWRWFEGDGLFSPLEREGGLPIGNLTSQFLSNVVLDALDHDVKDRWRVRAYARYCDDMVIFGRSAGELNALRHRIVDRLASLRLAANDRKTQVFPTAQGVPWMGFMIQPHRTSMRRHTVSRVRRRFRRFANRGRTVDVAASLAAWRGHAIRGLGAARMAQLESLAARRDSQARWSTRLRVSPPFD